MKRMVSKVLTSVAAAFVAVSFMACPTPNSTDPDNTNGTTEADIWEGAELLEDFAGKEVSWDKGGPLAVASSVSKRLQKDSKIIFELDYNTIAAEYIQFHVEDGSWGAVGVKDYYNAKGTKLDVEEETNEDGSKTGRYKIAVQPGVYYTVVTEDVLAKLQSSLGFGGNFKLVKVGITNLAEPTAPASDRIYSGEEITFTALDASTNETDIVLLLKYDRSAEGKKESISLSEVDLSITINGTAVSTPTELDFALDQYGAKFDDDASGDDNLKEYKIKIPLGTQLAKDDVVKVKLNSAKLADKGEDATEDTANGIQAALIDGAAAVGYYKELAANEYVSLVGTEE